MADNSLNDALKHFEIAEANLGKAERVLTEIQDLIPTGIAFGDRPEHEDRCRAFSALLESLPKIDGWKPEISLPSLNDIAQERMDAHEAGDVGCVMSVEMRIDEPGKLLREYRYRFNTKRRALVRDALVALVDEIDANLRHLSDTRPPEVDSSEHVSDPQFGTLKEQVAQINTLLGSEPRPTRWSDLGRHLHFGMYGDLTDIIKTDWPTVKIGLRKSLYGEREPIPTEIADLGTLVKNKPQGPIATRLLWERLDEDMFERLMFAIISSEPSYQNPEWLTKPNAADRGRDLSAYRVHSDPLAGVVRLRVIIQCKHWLSTSVGVSEVATLREQMKLWEHPRVDVHVIATSGRFTSDAVALIEKHNTSDSALRIEPWPESHLERILASKPALIAEFGLR